MLLLNMTNNIKNNIPIANNNASLSKSATCNYANFSATNDNNISLVNMHSARLEILGRIICSKLERTLCTHVLMIVSC